MLGGDLDALGAPRGLDFPEPQHVWRCVEMNYMSDLLPDEVASMTSVIC